MFEPEIHRDMEQRKPVFLFGILGMLLVFFVVGLFTVRHLATPPENFPLEEDILISEGLNQSEITDLMKKSGVVRSSLYLYIRLHQLYPGEFIQAGMYRFSEPLDTDAVAKALVLGENRSPLLKFTLPEGFHAAELSKYLPEELGIQDTKDLKRLEGYLFPDTYFISPGTSLDEILALIDINFKKKIDPLLPRINESPFSLEEVLTFASIIEREAKDTESKRMVSGILRNRLNAGMPLQVDAVFDYLLGKTSAELTEEDLDLDSPYNTYLHTGLPPGPIANPGLESITAVLDPIQSDYFYYLTGDDGVFHYAETFEEHKENKDAHLR